MTINELLSANPLIRLEGETGELLPGGCLGGVLSPAGVGKTAFVVQIAIDAMLQKKAVLHVSLGDSIDKITLWYRELFQNLTEHHSITDAEDIWQSILPWRFIMTFKVAKFSAPILEERLADLKEQNIFDPSIVIIDGLHLEGGPSAIIDELKGLAEKQNLSLWVTANLNRSDNDEEGTIPEGLSSIAEPLASILELKPGDRDIKVTALKGTRTGDTGLRLDPASMLIRGN